MRLRCPNCGGTSCVQLAEQVINAASSLYAKCASCNDLILDKRTPIDRPDTCFEDLKCTSCGRRPLDAIMGHVLCLAVGQKNQSALTLRQVGTPLLSPGVPTYAPPHLGYHNLLLVTKQKLIADVSDLILNHVTEIKGVIYGDTKRVIGLADSHHVPYTCRVSAGCDMRADLVTSAYGQVLVHKSQSKIHIEHDNFAKIAKLGSLPIAGKVVLDALAGPGTLGLVCVLMGARKVILNDAWLPAVENAYLNLRTNRKILGIRTLSRVATKKRTHSTTPYLHSTASTDHTLIELYHGDFEEFNVKDSGAQLILLDPFPTKEHYFANVTEEIHNKLPKVDIVQI